MHTRMLSVIDLFAGCGGLSLGLKWAGWNIVCAVEHSPMAAETYFANFVASRTDIDTQYSKHRAKTASEQVRAGLLVDDVQVFNNCLDTIQDKLKGRELTLLSGGPPCQGFSLAGRRHSNDPRNNLVWSFLQLARDLRPLAVLMENVDAIRHPFDRDSPTNVLSDLERALRQVTSSNGGYVITPLSLRADHYGVPQRRQRVFLVGIRKDVASLLNVGDRELWASGQNNAAQPANPVAPIVSTEDAPTARDALWDIVGEQYAPIDEAPSSQAKNYATAARSGLHGAPPNHKFRRHTDATRTRFQLIRLFREHGISRRLFEYAATRQTSVEPYLKSLESCLPIEFPIGRVTTLHQLTDLVLSLPSRKRSQRALDGQAPAPTITTLPDDLCHYQASRTLTVREMARLQSFPDSFIFRGKETTGGQMRRLEVPQYSQVGNAVPPMLAKSIGLHLRDLLLRT